MLEFYRNLGVLVEGIGYFLEVYYVRLEVVG